MIYTTGKTFDYRTDTGSMRWEKFEITLDMDDLADFCASQSIPLPTDTKYRALLLRACGIRIESNECLLRHYISANQAADMLGESAKLVDTYRESLGG